MANAAVTVASILCVPGSIGVFAVCEAETLACEKLLNRWLLR